MKRTPPFRLPEVIWKSTLASEPLHDLAWDGVDWAMSHLGKGLTANQQHTRELVYGVDEMLADNLDSVPFPFIGCERTKGTRAKAWRG